MTQIVFDLVEKPGCLIRIDHVWCSLGAFELLDVCREVLGSGEGGVHPVQILVGYLLQLASNRSIWAERSASASIAFGLGFAAR